MQEFRHSFPSQMAKVVSIKAAPSIPVTDLCSSSKPSAQCAMLFVQMHCALTVAHHTTFGSKETYIPLLLC